MKSLTENEANEWEIIQAFYAEFQAGINSEEHNKQIRPVVSMIKSKMQQGPIP